MKTHKVRPLLVDSKMPTGLWLMHNQHQGLMQLETASVLDGKPGMFILISLEDAEIEVGDDYYCTVWKQVNTCTSVGASESSKHLIFRNGYPDTRSTSKKVMSKQLQLSPELIQQLVDEYSNGGMKDFEIEMIEKIHNQYSGANAQWKELLPKLTNGFVTVVEKETNLDIELKAYGISKRTWEESQIIAKYHDKMMSSEPTRYTEEEVIKYSYWLRTTDFNVEGHSPEDCLREFNKNKK